MSDKPTNAVTHTYFVSFHYSSSTGYTIGNLDITIPYRLADMEAIRYLQADMRKHFNAADITILGFSPINPR